MSSLDPPQPAPPEPEGAGGASDDARSLDARERLGALVDGAVTHHRVSAQHDAERLQHVFRVLEFAAVHAGAFVAARFEGAAARDLARRAAIAELATALRMTERRVDRLASDAAVLCRQLPRVLQGMRDGDLDYEQAKVVIDAVDPLADRPEIIAALDEELADLARSTNPARLRRAARLLVERVQADTITARHAKARAERRVELQPARDGMAWLHLLLPAADAMLIRNRLCRAADRLRTSGPAESGGASAPAERAEHAEHAEHAERLDGSSFGVRVEHGESDAEARGDGAATDASRTSHERALQALAAEKRLDQIRADLARDLLLHGLPPETVESSDPAPPATDTGQSTPTGTRTATGTGSSTRTATATSTATGTSTATATATATSPSTTESTTAGVGVPGGRASLSGIRPTVHVTVPVLTLLGRTEAPGSLDGYGPIDADTARTLASHAPSFTRLLTHPVTGAVLDVDRTSYRVPSDLRTWLQVRDETCRFPGCTRAAIGCDVDHTDDWAAKRGTTAHDNLAHLCPAHHHLKHDTAWSVRHVTDGHLEWMSPTGRQYISAPTGGLLPNDSRRSASTVTAEAPPGRFDPPPPPPPPRRAGGATRSPHDDGSTPPSADGSSGAPTPPF